MNVMSNVNLPGSLLISVVHNNYQSQILIIQQKNVACKIATNSTTTNTKSQRAVNGYQIKVNSKPDRSISV